MVAHKGIAPIRISPLIFEISAAAITPMCDNGGKPRSCIGRICLMKTDCSYERLPNIKKTTI